MNTGGEGVTEIEAKNDAHSSFSGEANADDAEHEYREVDRINTDSRMAESLSEQLGEERTQVSITSLPHLVMAMIFSHLKAHFLITTLAKVCRYFDNMVRFEWVWKSRKTLSINEEESGIDFIMTVIPKCPNICHLNVNFCFLGPETSLTIPNMTFPYLRSLVITNVEIRAENAVVMIIQGSPHLRVIKLTGVTTTKMLEATAQAKELTTFSVGDCRFLLKDNERDLTNVFKSCCKLETVYFKFYGHVDVNPVLTLLEVCSGTLKRFTWNCKLSGPAMEKISRCPQISHLDISIVGVRDESLKFIRYMKQIETLRLHDIPRLSNAGYIQMFKDNPFPLLKHLSFDSRVVDDRVIETIAITLKDLESLDLYDTNVSDLGIRYMLPHCSNLRALRLTQFRVYSFVKDLPIFCPHLHFLGLFNKPIPEPIIQEFLNTHPSYKINPSEELTDLNFKDLITVDLSDISLKPVIAYHGDGYVKHILGHK